VVDRATGAAGRAARGMVVVRLVRLVRPIRHHAELADNPRGVSLLRAYRGAYRRSDRRHPENEKALFPGPFLVERAGIEPATSGLQSDFSP
jgi:hypothetical protein